MGSDYDRELSKGLTEGLNDISKGIKDIRFYQHFIFLIIVALLALYFLK